MAKKTGVSMNWGGLDTALGKAAKALHGRRKALLAEVGEAMVSSTMQRFIEGVGPDGTPWTPSQRALAQNGKTLVDKAHLQNSISAAVTSDAVFWGSNLPYAQIHQKGGKAGRGKKVTLPARPYLGLNNDDREEIAAIVSDFAKDAFKG